MEIILPTSKVPAEQSSPRNLVIFSKPKTGKTTLLSQLDGCLILDLEKGSKYVDAMKVEAKSIEEIKQIGKAIIEAGNPYKYIAVDTITALEEMCIPYAEQLYMKTPMGKNWPTDGKLKYGTIIGLPNGAGYQYLREAFTKAIAYIQTWAPRVILVGHVKDTMLEKDGAEFNSLDLDLTGKLKRITASNSDSIGYLYRKGKKNILSFKTSDDIACGARPKHLSNQEIVLSEIDAEGNITTNWDKIYID
jgi:energy-coupling factor transporter ATP-binding protein EcfA2